MTDAAATQLRSHQLPDPKKGAPFVGVLVLATLAGCSDSPPPQGGLGNAGAAGASVAPVTGGVAGQLPTAGTAGGNLGGGASVMGGAAGTSSGSTSGGENQVGGQNVATAGSGGVSGTGGQGGSAGDTNIAAELGAMRLEAPCIDADHFGLDKTDNCELAADVDRQSYQRHLGGDPSVIYDVKFRVRGLTEPNIYVEGALTPPRFYVGGHSSHPDYAAYSITVGDPAQMYFFNDNDTVGHFVFQVDLEVVIPMRGGTQVTFDVNGPGSVPNGHGVSNRESVVVPDIAPAPMPFNGQFLQFDVLSATPRQ